jgi:2-haloacid dehalogenase
MVGGSIEPTVAILAALRERQVPLYALSNWSAETFARVRTRFEFLAWFAGMVISGEVGLLKPDPEIFNLLCERFRLTPQRTVFVDDVAANVAGAEAAGFVGIHFTSSQDLRLQLGRLGLLPASA